MITKEQYLKAKAIVNQYYKEQPSKTDKQTGNYKPKPMIEKSQTLTPPAPTGTIKVLETLTALEIQQLKEILEHWNDSLGELCIDASAPKFISL